MILSCTSLHADVKIMGKNLYEAGSFIVKSAICIGYKGKRCSQTVSNIGELVTEGLSKFLAIAEK